MLNATAIMVSHYFDKMASHWIIKGVGASMFSMFFFVFPEDSVQNLQLMSLFALIGIDTILGIMAAIKEGQGIKSRKLFSLSIKVLIYFLIIASAHITDMALVIPINLGGFLASWLVIVELISILENAARFGFPLPVVVINFLKGKVNLMEKSIIHPNEQK